MKKLSKKGKGLVVISLLVLLVISLSLTAFFAYKSFKPGKSKIKKVDEMSEYGYFLEKNSTKLYVKLYEELKEVLSKKEIDEKEYASLVARLFSSDYYTLSNKISKDHIGGVQFVYQGSKENFVLESSDTVYKYVEQNIYGKRKQDLPEVTKVEVKEINNINYSYKDINDSNAYDIKLSLEYKTDMGYPKDVEVKLIHNDKKLEVIYFN